MGKDLKNILKYAIIFSLSFLMREKVLPDQEDGAPK